MLPDLVFILFPILLLALGYGVGRWRERRHLVSLAQRERQFQDIVLTNLKTGPNPDRVQNAAYVSGDAVIATDYFKTFAATIRNIIGGEVRAFETLMNRARREAILRMQNQARQMGASEIWNVRLETSNIRSGGGSNNKAVSVEVFAFGTAIVR